jgi:hypothetical protein
MAANNRIYWINEKIIPAIKLKFNQIIQLNLNTMLSNANAKQIWAKVKLSSRISQIMQT